MNTIEEICFSVNLLNQEVECKSNILVIHTYIYTYILTFLYSKHHSTEVCVCASVPKTCQSLDINNALHRRTRYVSSTSGSCWKPQQPLNEARAKAKRTSERAVVVARVFRERGPNWGSVCCSGSSPPLRRLVATNNFGFWNNWIGIQTKGE